MEPGPGISLQSSEATLDPGIGGGNQAVQQRQNNNGDNRLVKRRHGMHDIPEILRMPTK